MMYWKFLELLRQEERLNRMKKRGAAYLKKQGAHTSHGYNEILEAKTFVEIIDALKCHDGKDSAFYAEMVTKIK